MLSKFFKIEGKYIMSDTVSEENSLVSEETASSGMKEEY